MTLTSSLLAAAVAVVFMAPDGNFQMVVRNERIPPGATHEIIATKIVRRGERLWGDPSTVIHMMADCSRINVAIPPASMDMTRFETRLDYAVCYPSARHLQRQRKDIFLLVDIP